MLESSPLQSSLSTEGLPVLFATASLFPDLLTLSRSSGILTFDQGQLTARFETPTGETTSTISIAQLTTDLSNSLKQLQGSLTFDGGIVTRSLITPTGNLTGSVAFAEEAAERIRNFVKGISGNVAFADGKIEVDIPTLFGQVKGAIEFGNGALVTNLTTPFGGYFSSIDFKESDQYQFNFGGFPGVVNFNDGLVILDFQPQTPDDEIAIPINALSGNIAFQDGQATLNLPTPFGSLATRFDLSALVPSDALRGSGTVKFNNGIASIDVSGGLGTINTTLDLPKLVQTVGSTLATAQGTIQFNNGVITSDLQALLG
ncbi:MAG: hypothetical protein MUC48_17195 [Leptolyngbya sp. Prado105]|jgi:hypothetical protein|nr:hypothetical protein [Leptolyngbya sp. Prado105]